MDALVRVWAFVWSFVAGFVLGFVTLVALVWGIIDVIWQLVTNGEGLSEDGRLVSLVVNTFQWATDLQIYALTGKRRFSWLPTN